MRMPRRRRQANPETMTLMVTGNPDDPFTLMIEPWGMTYELDAGERIYVDLEVSLGDPPELNAWPGGFAIWPPGRAVTRDADGAVLHVF